MVEWHSIEARELIKRFETRDTGLSNEEAGKKLEQYGENTIEIGKKVSPIHLFVEQFTSPLVLMLIAAAIFSFGFGKGIDGILIITIVIANGFFGFWQNYNAEKSIEALQKLGAPKALVYRNGAVVEVSAEKVVPGDILILKEGEKISADARLIECNEIKIDESILTGESYPVRKNTKIFPKDTLLADRKNMIFMNTLIVGGKGKALVVATGKTTQVGKIAEKLQTIEDEPTRFHKEITKLSKKISASIIVLILIIAVILLLFQNTELIDVIFTSISLAVAAIPEGLPAVVTLSLAIATKKMLKKKSLVRKLSVIESLGSVNIICTDKTGTLTENSMTIQEIFYDNKNYKITGTGRSTEGEFLLNGKKANSKNLEQILLCGMACNDTIIQETDGKTTFLGDPTEIALTVSALKANVSLEGMKRIKDYPFSSSRKKMTAVYDYGAKKVAFSKGAPEVVIDSCTHVLIDGKKKALTENDKQTILDENNKMASKAMRVLGLAFKDVSNDNEAEKGMVFLGLQAMIDPPRKEVKSALETARKAGIRVLMLTGDNRLTAQAIGEKIGFTGKVTDARELEKLSQQEFKKAVEECDIFARVNPEQKLSIMQALQEKGYSVAMTGDGVNDAPALKQADVGIAMGLRGSDVAKESSDIVILDDNFATIIEAIKQGRGVFDNIQKFVRYLLTSNLAEVLIVFIVSVAGIFLAPGIGLLAITPIQILWINLLTDGMPALALGADPPKPGIMRNAPRKKNEGIITKPIGSLIIIVGLILTIIISGIFFYYLPRGLVLAQTMVFTSLIIYEFVRIVVIREEEKLGFFSNKWLVIALVGSVALQLLILYNPFEQIIPLTQWFGVISLDLMDWIIIGGGAIIAYVSSLAITKAVLRHHKQIS